jgi:hypothetical protein
MTIAPMTLPDMSRKHSMLVIYKHCSHITYLTNYRQKKSKNNIQDMDLSAKCGCIMCTFIVYWRTANFLVCLVCQKLANCTFISNSRVTTSKF